MKAATEKIARCYQIESVHKSDEGPNLHRESVCKDSRDGFASQMEFYSRVLLRIWTKIAYSNNSKVDQNCNLTRDRDKQRKNLYFSPKFMCQKAVWYTLKLFECEVLVQIRNKTLE